MPAIVVVEEMKQSAPSEAKDGQRSSFEPASSTRQRKVKAFAPPGRLTQLAAMINSSPRVQALAQLKDSIQCGAPDPAEWLPEVDRQDTAQMRSDPGDTGQERESKGGSGPSPNRTGLPDQLKAGVENLSGMSLDNVKVHYNSARPAQLNALAYAQGSDIHIAPGQEQHLPHEAWHVVQQAQGRVKPTFQMKAGIAVNDDQRLEHEADAMGTRAMSALQHSLGEQIVQRSIVASEHFDGGVGTTAPDGPLNCEGNNVVQRATVVEMDNAVQRFWDLRRRIKDLLDGGNIREEQNTATLHALTRDLHALAGYVSRDDDHQIYKSAYEGIYDFTDTLLSRLYAIDPDLTERMELDRILDLMRAGTARVLRPGVNLEEIRNRDPVKYVATLPKIDVDGAGLTHVLAQAAYMSGDMFGVAAALRLEPRLGVAIFYDHRLNKDREIETRLLEFYKTKSGAEHPRVALIPVTDSAAAYKNSIAGDFSNLDLFPFGPPRIVSAVGGCLSIGHATSIVAEHYRANAGAARREIEDEWLPEGAREGTARGQSSKTIAAWVAEKGFDRSKSYAFIWFRQSGQRGGAHRELDTSEEATRQIIDTAKRGAAADALVVIGDRGHHLERVVDMDLTEFWNEPGSPFEGSGRKMQLALFAYLVHNRYNIMNIGMRSGALEGPALLGVKTVFLEEKYNFQEGRMDQWQGAVPGFSRVELEHVPTREGKAELRRLIALTLAAREAEYQAALNNIERLHRGGNAFVGTAISDESSGWLDLARGRYEPADLATALTAVIRRIEAGARQTISVLFGASKGQIVAEIRKAIRARQEWQKAKIKESLDASYAGPAEGLSGTDIEKMWSTIATGVGGWEEAGGRARGRGAAAGGRGGARDAGERKVAWP